MLCKTFKEEGGTNETKYGTSYEGCCELLEIKLHVKWFGILSGSCFTHFIGTRLDGFHTKSLVEVKRGLEIKYRRENEKVCLFGMRVAEERLSRVY